MDRESLYRRALGIAEPPSVAGHWIYIDGGTLDLGLVRDSRLTSSADFQIFGEVFEGVAFVHGGKCTSTNGDTA